MNKWKTIFLSDNGLSPMHQFRQIVDRYEGNKNFRTLRCLDQFMCMVLPQLTYRESSHDIECCLRAMQPKLYHMGIKGKPFEVHWPMQIRIAIGFFIAILHNS